MANFLIGKEVCLKRARTSRREWQPATCPFWSILFKLVSALTVACQVNIKLVGRKYGEACRDDRRALREAVQADRWIDPETQNNSDPDRKEEDFSIEK
jgi:hypothetical protein